jgi:hypothetical protein
VFHACIPRRVVPAVVRPSLYSDPPRTLNELQVHVPLAAPSCANVLRWRTPEVGKSALRLGSEQVGEKSSLEGLYGEEANAAMRREYEAAAPTPEAEEATESAVAVLVDEHGVAIENLPKGTNSGFFLDAPSKVQVHTTHTHP